MKNKEQRVWMIVTIVTVTVLVFIFAGITYAFFTTSDNEGSTAEIISDSGKMLITYGDGTNTLVVAEDVSPNNQKIIADKTFSLTGTNTTDGLTMPFNISLEYQNTFINNELWYFIKRVDNSEKVVVNIVSSPKDVFLEEFGVETFPQEYVDELEFPQELVGYYVDFISDSSNNPYSQGIAKGYFMPNSENETVTFNLKIMFIDIGKNQDYNKGAVFNGKIIINEEDSEIMQPASQFISNLYQDQTKDENGITLDGLQKDGTGSFNVTLLNNNQKKYGLSLLNTDNVLADMEYDGYDNLRFVGQEPNNYIWFNNTIWRIIGVFNNITSIDENGVEKKENLIKIVSALDKQYSWDTSDSSINNGAGINEWSQADLMTELNTDYLDTTKTSGTTYWYDGPNNQKTGEYNYSNNIKSKYLNKIAKVRWNLGGINTNEIWLENYSPSNKKFKPDFLLKNYLKNVSSYNLDMSTYKAMEIYEAERGTNHIVNPADGVVRQDYWEGKIALPYLSDIAYASSNDSCRIGVSYENCRNNNWFYNAGHNLTTSLLGENLSVGIYRHVNANPVCRELDVFPTLFLKSDVTISGGKGTSSELYVIDEDKFLYENMNK